MHNLYDCLDIPIIIDRNDVFRSREPKFVLKVKQNRYEKFIIDELRIESNDIDEMIQQLEDAIIQINTKLAEVVA